MVKDILTGAGLVENQTFKECRFVKPPKVDYAVYFSSFTSRGADNLNLIKDYSISIELYCYKPNKALESAIETNLDNRGLEFQKMDRQWLESEQLYQVVYFFNYVEK